MSQGRLEQFGAYTKAMAMFDNVVEDMNAYMTQPTCARLVSQQLASADSVCANIEEGFGRETTKEYLRFLVIARDSARETLGRYGRMKHWIAPEIIEKRELLLNDITSILTTTISTLRSKVNAS